MAHDTAVINFSDPAQKRMARQLVGGLSGLYWFECRRCKDQRTLSQNAYFHGVVCVDIAAGLTEAWGEPWDVYQTKELLKGMFLKVTAINHNTGEEMGEYVRHTRDLTTEEMSVFIDRCIFWALDRINTTVRPADRFNNNLEPAATAAT